MPNGSIEFCTLNNNLRQIVSVTADLEINLYGKPRCENNLRSVPGGRGLASI
jgi:hypothetical protein